MPRASRYCTTPATAPSPIGPAAGQQDAVDAIDRAHRLQHHAEHLAGCRAVVVGAGRRGLVEQDGRAAGGPSRSRCSVRRECRRHRSGIRRQSARSAAGSVAPDASALPRSAATAPIIVPARPRRHELAPCQLHGVSDRQAPGCRLQARRLQAPGSGLQGSKLRALRLPAAVWSARLPVAVSGRRALPTTARRVPHAGRPRADAMATTLTLTMSSLRRVTLACTIVAVIALAVLPAGGAPERLVFHDIQVDAAGSILPWYSPKPSVAYDHAIRAVWRFWTRHADVPERRPLLHAAPGLEARRRGSARARRRPARHGALIVEPAARLPGRPGDRQQHALHRRLLPGAWPLIARVEVAAPAVPVQRGRCTAARSTATCARAGDSCSRTRPDPSAPSWSRWRRSPATPSISPPPHAWPTRSRRRSWRAMPSTRPWPYRVHVDGTTKPADPKVWTAYTTNWTGALRLFEALKPFGRGDTAQHDRARALVTAWLAAYPMKTNNWGPFFEDIVEYSNTAINAGTMAQYLARGSAARSRLAAARTRASSTGSSARSRTRSSPGTASRPSTSRPPTRCPATATPSRHASLELMYAARTRRLVAQGAADPAAQLGHLHGRRRRPQPVSA